MIDYAISSPLTKIFGLSRVGRLAGEKTDEGHSKNLFIDLGLRLVRLLDESLKDVHKCFHFIR